MALTVAAINSVGALGERGPSATERVRAVIYTRVSTEMQSETSMQEQERRRRQFAEYRGYEIVRTYKDYGKSGTNTNREEYQEMMADIDSWDIVILFKLTAFTVVVIMPIFGLPNSTRRARISQPSILMLILQRPWAWVSSR